LFTSTCTKHDEIDEKIYIKTMRSAIPTEETSYKKTARLLHNSSRFCTCICGSSCLYFVHKKTWKKKIFLVWEHRSSSNGDEFYLLLFFFIIILLLFCCVQKYNLCVLRGWIFSQAHGLHFFLLYSALATSDSFLREIQKGGIANADSFFFVAYKIK
jgi:hypothetical protein